MSLEFVERGQDIGDEPTLHALRLQGLIERVLGAWALTPQGELRLRNLRSVLQIHAR